MADVEAADKFPIGRTLRLNAVVDAIFLRDSDLTVARMVFV